MQTLLSMLHSLGPKSSVPEIIFTTVGALANVIEKDFAPYMEAFAPFFYAALGNQDDPALCSVATGLVSDITRSMGEFAQPYCDAFMNHLLNNLRVRLCSTSPTFQSAQGEEEGRPEAVGERGLHRADRNGGAEYDVE